MDSTGKCKLWKQIAGRGAFASVTVSTTASERGLAVTVSAEVSGNPFVDAARAGVSQQTGIDQGALSRFVHGKRGLTLDNVDLIANLLGLEVTQKKAK